MNYRKNIYERFSKIANSREINWIALHGYEGYPNTIGRDLDITCSSEREEILLLKFFYDVLKLHKDTKAIVFLPPIWGKRIIGISKDFDVAELHIVRPIRTSIVSFIPDFQNKYMYSGLFPVTYYLSFVKICVMPAITSQYKKIDILDIDKKMLPESIWKIYDSLVKFSTISRKEKLLFFISYAIHNPVNSFRNFFYWLYRKIFFYKYLSVPLVYVDEKMESEFREVISNKLSILFASILNGNNLSLKNIRWNQARQHLVYFTDKKKYSIYDVYINRKLKPNDYLDIIVQHFVGYNNKRWQLFYEKKFEKL